MLDIIANPVYANVLSTLAILISIGTAVLSGYAFWESRANLSIRALYPETTSLMFAPLKQDSYQSSARLCLYIEISNLSSRPISISSFVLKPADHPEHEYKFESFDIADQQYPVARYPENAFYFLPIGKEQLHLPLKIDAYCIAVGYIFTAVSDTIRPFDGTLIAKTPGKTFKLKVHISQPSTPDPKSLRILSGQEL